MLQKIVVSLMWTVVSGTASVFAFFAIRAVLQELGFLSWKPLIVDVVAVSLAVAAVATPLVVLVLGLRGTLPGTKKPRRPSP